MSLIPQAAKIFTSMTLMAWAFVHSFLNITKILCVLLNAADTFSVQIPCSTVYKHLKMVPFKLKTVLAKFCLCLNCSQKLDECSLAYARKTFAADSHLDSC